MNGRGQSSDQSLGEHIFLEHNTFCVWHANTHPTFFSMDSVLSGVFSQEAWSHGHSTRNPLPQHPALAACLPSKELRFSSSLRSYAFISLANLLYLPTEFSVWWKPPAWLFLVSVLVCSQTCRHNMVWEDQFLLWGPVLSPRQWFMRWIPWGIFLFVHGDAPLAKS